jgi:transposase
MTVAVGIDIGSGSHAVAVCREGAQEAERKGLKIAANRGGFDDLDAWLRRQPEPVARVVMESSGHYWFNLASHLRRQGYPVAVVNPLEAKYFGKRRLQRSKRPRRCAHTGGVRHGRSAPNP